MKPVVFSGLKEICFVVPDAEGAALHLGRLPVLARRKPVLEQLIRYDTAEQHLRQQHIGLLLCRTPEQCQQILTIAPAKGGSYPAGEWKCAVSELSLPALQVTPWQELDPSGALFSALLPVTERTCWPVHKRSSKVDVTLLTGPLATLTLQLQAGPADALFDLASKIVSKVALLPVSQQIAKPLRAKPPALNLLSSLPEAASLILGEMFDQFTANLSLLLNSDDPEAVHQARVGWRRFRSALRLFKPVLAAEALPALPDLPPLLQWLGELRDLDVANSETLPPLAMAYIAGDAQRAAAWQQMTETLQQAALSRRHAVREALKQPAMGASLLLVRQWLAGLSAISLPAEASLQRWARRRVIRQHKQLKNALAEMGDLEQQHRVRILSKRMRYSIEALRSLLPVQRTEIWYQQAVALQTSLGSTRDVIQAGILAEKWGASPGLAEFLRGVAAGREGLTG